LGRGCHESAAAEPFSTTEPLKRLEAVGVGDERAQYLAPDSSHLLLQTTFPFFHCPCHLMSS